MTSADFCSSIATLLSVASPVADKQIPQGKARDFIPIYPVHIRPVGPDGIGLRVFWPSRPPTSRLVCTSCSSGQEFAYSFLPTPPRGDAVAVRLGVPAIKVPRGLPSFKGHLLVSSRFAFAPRLTAPSMALRAMPGAPKKKGAAVGTFRETAFGKPRPGGARLGRTRFARSSRSLHRLRQLVGPLGLEPRTNRL